MNLQKTMVRWPKARHTYFLIFLQLCSVFSILHVSVLSKAKFGLFFVPDKQYVLHDFEFCRILHELAFYASAICIGKSCILVQQLQ